MSVNASKSFKIRARTRYRVHASAPKSEECVPQLEGIKGFSEKDLLPLTSNIFKNVVITPADLKQKLPSYSKKDESNLKVKSAITNQALNEGGRRRKIPFHEVVASAKDFLKKREEEKKKKATGILENFQALEDALPTLDQLMEENKKDKPYKPRAAQRLSKQDAEMMEDLQTFQQVLNDPEYAADPFGTITERLKQHIQSGCL